MRTKILLSTAAIGMAGMMGAMAQADNVYSINAVGYVNMELGNGFTMFANPLDNQAEGGNSLNNLLADTPPGTTVFKFEGTAFLDPAINFGPDAGGFTPNLELNPGEGAFIQLAVDAPITATMVGEVMQGSLANPIPAGLSIRGSMVPQEIDPDIADFGFPAAPGDTIFSWNADTQAYNDASIFFGADAGGWTPDVTIGIGESVFVQAQNAGSWDRDFSVND